MTEIFHVNKVHYQAQRDLRIGLREERQEEEKKPKCPLKKP